MIEAAWYTQVRVRLANFERKRSVYCKERFPGFQECMRLMRKHAAKGDRLQDLEGDVFRPFCHQLKVHRPHVFSRKGTPMTKPPGD